MAKEHNFLPKINRKDLLRAKDYLWVFFSLFITDDMRHNHRKIMPKLNSSQQTFLTFYLLDSSMRSGTPNHEENWSIKGGFLKLIYDGYGEYVFETPFSKLIKTWGAKKISGIIESAKSIYEKHKDKVKKIKTEKELSDLCAEISDFDKLDHKYMMLSDKEKGLLKEHIENNISKFAIIDENNTQDSSYVDMCIKDIEQRNRINEEMHIVAKYWDKIDELTKDGEDNILIMNESDYNKLTLFSSIYKWINRKMVKIEFQKDVR